MSDTPVTDEVIVYFDSYAQGAYDWAMAAFGAEVVADCAQRVHRFMEEALELAQACGMTRHEVGMLTAYVFDRPVGDVDQEIGGVTMTLGVLTVANKRSLGACAVAELASVYTRMEQIRAKQAAKVPGSPLPGYAPVSGRVDSAEPNEGAAPQSEDAA